MGWTHTVLAPNTNYKKMQHQQKVTCRKFLFTKEKKKSNKSVIFEVTESMHDLAGVNARQNQHWVEAIYDLLRYNGSNFYLFAN